MFDQTSPDVDSLTPSQLKESLIIGMDMDSQQITD